MTLGSGNDSLVISDDNATVYTSVGADTLIITGHDGYFNGGSGKDSIINSGNNVTLIGEAGDDTIMTTGNVAQIEGGAGADIISLGSSAGEVTVSGGAGADIIHTNGGSNVIQYKSGDGSDIVYGFDGEDSISISGASFKITTVGSDAVISVGSGKITLKDQTNIQSDGGIITIAERKFLPLTDKVNTSVFGSEYDGYIIDAMGGNDNLTVKGAKEISINGGAGTDRISLDGGDANNITIVGGKGNDTIHTNGNQNIIQYSEGDGTDSIVGFYSGDTILVTEGKISQPLRIGSNMVFGVGSGSSLKLRDIEFGEFEITSDENSNAVIVYKTGSDIHNGSDSADQIDNASSNVIIKARGGNDTITNAAGTTDVLISGGAGNDKIYSYSASATISGGEGTDLISLAGSGDHDNVIQYSAGDGKDTIYGFSGNDSIQIAAATVSAGNASQSSGDVVLTIGTGSITIKDTKLASLSFNGNVITTSKAVSGSNGYWFTDGDTNFLSGGAQLDEISAGEMSVTYLPTVGVDISATEFLSIVSAAE